MQGKYLNLGCGDTAPDGWVNCDSSWHAQASKIPGFHRFLEATGIASTAHWPRNIRYLSIGKRFPWDSGSVDCVYASHVFEHLSVRVTGNFMNESLRILKPGGVLRIVVPDLLFHARKYVSSWSDAHSGAEEFLSVLHLRLPGEEGLIRGIYNWVKGYPNLHKNMYDMVTLREIFIRYGFSDIRTAQYGVSHYIRNIRDVEPRAEGYEGSLYMEAVKT